MRAAVLRLPRALLAKRLAAGTSAKLAGLSAISLPVAFCGLLAAGSGSRVLMEAYSELFEYQLRLP